MNLRITTFLNFEGELSKLEPILNAISESVIANGFANEIDDDNKIVRSMIVVKENEEIYDVGKDEFFTYELANSLMTVLPTNEELEVEGLEQLELPEAQEEQPEE